MKTFDFNLFKCFRQPGWKAKSLPTKLVNEQNVDFLFGAKSFLRAHTLPSAVDMVLREYSQCVDLLSIANGNIPVDVHMDINMDVVVDESLKDKVYFAIKQRRAEKIFSFPIGPQFSMAVHHHKMPPKLIKASILPLLFNARSVCGLHVVYAHTFGQKIEDGKNIPLGLGTDDRAKSYVGVTKQGWAERFQQHERIARAGSPYHFHRAIREWSGLVAEQHQVLAYGMSHDEAMNLEEVLVDQYSLHPHGLNMIPGGFAGIRYLAKQGYTVGRKAWENRDVILRQFALHCERSGRPNPLLSALWNDDQFAAKVICSNPNNFNLSTVREIRRLSEFGMGVEVIAGRMNAKPERIQSLLDGRTYGRVQ